MIFPCGSVWEFIDWFPYWEAWKLFPFCFISWYHKNSTVDISIPISLNTQTAVFSKVKLSYQQCLSQLCRGCGTSQASGKVWGNWGEYSPQDGAASAGSGLLGLCQWVVWIIILYVCHDGKEIGKHCPKKCTYKWMPWLISELWGWAPLPPLWNRYTFYSTITATLFSKIIVPIYMPTLLDLKIFCQSRDGKWYFVFICIFLINQGVFQYICWHMLMACEVPVSILCLFLHGIVHFSFLLICHDYLCSGYY